MIPGSPSRPFPTSLKWALAIYFTCFLVLYRLLQVKYRLAEVDDTWWISFGYNLLHRDTLLDVISGSPNPVRGITYFGKAYSFVLGCFLDLAGWTKPNSYLLSLTFIFGGFGCWYFILRRLGYSLELAATFCVTGLLLDPFFSAALCARAEAFVFGTSSLSLLLFVSRRFYWAPFVAWVGMETHPTGCVAFFLMAAAFWAMRSGKGPLIPKPGKGRALFIAGFFSGVLFFLLMHHTDLGLLPVALASNNTLPDLSVQNFLFDYFFHSKYHRHLVDLGLLVLCLAEFLRKRMDREDFFILPLGFCLLLFSLIFRRPQYHYALYFYPFFLLLLARVVEVLWNPRWMVWGFLIWLVPQYLFAYHLNKDYDYHLEVASYRKLIPADSLPILGGPNAWFAYPGRDFYYSFYLGDFQKLGLRHFYLISDDGYRNNPGPVNAYIDSHFKAKPLGEFSMGRWKYTVLLEEQLPNRQ